MTSLFRPEHRQLFCLQRNREDTYHWAQNLFSQGWIVLRRLRYFEGPHPQGQTFAGTKTINKIPPKKNIIPYFVSILEELDVIRLWDFQSHSADESAVITVPGMSQVRSFPARYSVFISLSFPRQTLVAHRFLIAVHVTSLGTGIRFDHPPGDKAGLLALSDEFRTCLVPVSFSTGNESAPSLLETIQSALVLEGTYC
jgi:hypothetical protein